MLQSLFVLLSISRSCYTEITVHSRCHQIYFTFTHWCTRVYMHTLVYAGVHAYTGVRGCTRTHWCTWVYMHTLVYAGVHARTGVRRCTCTHWCTQVYMHALVYAGVHVHTCVCGCTSVSYTHLTLPTILRV